MKFRGAGQGLKVLVAEVVVGELARRLGLKVPELRAITLDPAIGRYEADEEVQDLLTASVGLNLGVDFLPGAFGWDAEVVVEPDEAAAVLWLDAYTANVDRTWRNPNVLLWHRRLWLIDHGAALYFHHGWTRGATGAERFAVQPYDAGEHIMTGRAGDLAAVDAELSSSVTQELLGSVLACVPDEWLEPVPGRDGPDGVRQAYVEYLMARLQHGRAWLPGRSAA
jgi:hypothetical protein